MRRGAQRKPTPKAIASAATPDQAAPPGSPPELSANLSAFPAPHGNYTNDRVVTGSRINAANVATLTKAWSFGLSGKSPFGVFSANPIVTKDSVYLQDMNSNIFKLDRATGALTQPGDEAGCLTQAATSGCAQGIGLSSPEGMAASADGKNVYVATAISNAVLSLERDPSTGALTQATDGVMGTLNGAFRPNDTVTRVSLAYSLVQSMGLQAEARAFSGNLTVMYDGRRIAIEDAASIPASLRGYVQLALDRGLINARFAVVQGPFDLQPTLKAYFDPSKAVTRAAYAVAAGRYMVGYQAAED